MKPFRFKRFTVEQDRCAMKIGTDGVLLGAWASIKHLPYSILDIGAGTGVIALMLAQRSSAELIDALEIDDDAYEQCVENFENSPWGDRLFCYDASLQEFSDEMDDKYDLIVSNPPFLPPLPSAFPPILRLRSVQVEGNLPEQSRKMARYYDAMPFGHLVESVSKLLSNTGLFSVIIPFKEEETVIGLAKKHKLFPKRITRVKGTPNSEIKRSMMEFILGEASPKISEIIIETSRHNYTQDYINLTKDFYLKM